MNKLEKMLLKAQESERISIDREFQKELKQRLVALENAEEKPNKFWNIWKRLSITLVPVLVSISLFFYFYYTDKYPAPSSGITTQEEMAPIPSALKMAPAAGGDLGTEKDATGSGATPVTDQQNLRQAEVYSNTTDSAARMAAPVLSAPDDKNITSGTTDRPQDSSPFNLTWLFICIGALILVGLVPFFAARKKK